MKVICDYCNNKAVLVTGKELYPHRPDLVSIKAWQCKPCNASVGCHKNSKDNIPLGRLANPELKRLKQDAHAAFDPLWKSGKLTRKEAYAWLSHAMDIDPNACHIGMFNEDLCRKVVKVCNDQKG